MFDVVPMPFYLFFAIGSLAAMVGIGILLPFGIACYETSSKLLAGWGTRGRMRLEVKMVKGLRPIGVRLGSGEFSFFVLRKSTTSTYYEAVMSCTINALVT